MRIAEYKQIDTEIVKETIHHDAVYDEDENGRYGVISEEWDEEVTREIPVMGMVYRDMTEEEEAEALRQQAEFEEMERNRPKTAEERVEELEARNDFLEECLIEMANIIYA